MDWQDEKIYSYWHEIMDDISWYSEEDEAYILTRLINKMALELTTIVRKG